MDISNSVHWKITQILQNILGIWPYSTKPRDKYLHFVVFLNLHSLLMPILIKIIEEIGVNVQIVIENIMAEGICLFIILKYIFGILNKKKQQKIYEKIKKDWTIIDDEEELCILNNVAVAFPGISLIREILNYVATSENRTVSLELPYYLQFNIDHQKYYALLMVLISLHAIFSATVIAAHDTAFIMIVYHVYSLFEILILRLKKVDDLCRSIEKSKDFVHSDYNVYYSIIKSIKLHQSIIESIKYIEEVYNIHWFFTLIGTTCGIGSGFFIVLLKKNHLDLCRYFLFSCSILSYEYFVFLPGQTIINYNLDIFYFCSSCKWYNLSSKNKVLIKFMIMKSLKPCYFTGGKIFIMYMETYSLMMKRGLSYFMVFYNTNKS